jgi:hypothetical protein
MIIITVSYKFCHCERKKCPDYGKSRNQVPVAKKQALRRTDLRPKALSGPFSACRGW